MAQVDRRGDATEGSAGIAEGMTRRSGDSAHSSSFSSSCLMPIEDSSRSVGRMLSGRMAYAVVVGVVGLGLFASVTPSPLYQIYAGAWHFSALTLTLVYSTYALGVLATLLLAGSISDQVGRRPVLILGLSVVIASAVVYIFGNSVAWLFVARGLQGLATGLLLSTASAAMLDLHPNRSAGVGITNAIVSASGIALGILVSAGLVQLGWEPRTLPYLVLAGLFAVALIGSVLMSEPLPERQRVRLTPMRPRVPIALRQTFLLASLAAVVSWSIGGLFFSLGPALSADLFRSTNVIVSVVGVVTLAGSAAVAGLLLGRIAPWISTSVGSAALATGVILIVVAAAIESSALYVAGSAVGGVGFGLAFLGGLRGLVSAIPDEERSAVMSAFYVVAYLSLSVPAVLAGVAVPHLGIRSTFEVFGTIVASAAMVGAFQAFRTRPIIPEEVTIAGTSRPASAMTPG